MSESSETTWTLKPVQAGGLPPRIEFDRDGLTVGRAASNHVSLEPEAYPHVSSHHARFLLNTDGMPEVEDLGSRNGTFVNGKQVTRRQLRDGDVVRLGTQGPQFVVENTATSGSATVVDTLSLPRPATEMSQTTVFRVRRALGLPEDADVSQMVRTSEERSRRWLAYAAVAGALAVAASAWAVRASSRGEVARLERLNAELHARVAANSESLARERAAWDEQRNRLQGERNALLARIQKLADQEQTATTELAQLRQDLASTNQALARYDPLTLEQSRQSEVARVQRAVVFVETRIHYESDKTGKKLRLRRGSGAEAMTPTFDEGDELFERESSGSGFCISADGHIVTNAHVVRPNGYDAALDYDENERLQPKVEFNVLFSNSAERRPAQLLRVLADGDDDLALLRIEPFPGMAHLLGFTTDTAPPAPGAEVYLHGFPLGKLAIQDGDKVVVSSFRGILSRTVSSWLQVDAAVHPGNSGGPLTDSTGRVIGVVCRVQRISESALAPDMGYAIPIARVAQMWPLPAETGK